MQRITFGNQIGLKRLGVITQYAPCLGQVDLKTSPSAILYSLGLRRLITVSIMSSLALVPRWSPDFRHDG